jgi:hypothetical protein
MSADEPALPAATDADEEEFDAWWQAHGPKELFSFFQRRKFRHAWMASRGKK